MNVYVVLGEEGALELAIPDGFASENWLRATPTGGYLIRSEHDHASEIAELIGIGLQSPGIVVRLDDYKGILDTAVINTLTSWLGSEPTETPAPGRPPVLRLVRKNPQDTPESKNR